VKKELRKRLAGLKEPVRLIVFTQELECQVCQSSREFVEFPHVAAKYGVVSVPKTVVNETFSIEGALPEKQFAEQVMKAVRGG
jgi:predicted DsbA family dithiol-disulfide isomerase